MQNPPDNTTHDRARSLMSRNAGSPIEALIVLAFAEERERCAKIAETMADWSEVADSSTGYAIAERMRSGM